MLEFLIGLLIIIVTFFLALFLTRAWIGIARKNAIVGRDMQKHDGRIVSEAGGLPVIMSAVIATLIYIFFKTFIISSPVHVSEILTIIITLVLACFVGFIDDITGWKKGLRAWQKVLMTVIVAIPMVVVNAGHSSIVIPFIGQVNLGLIYPLIIVPIGLIGATNGMNLLAGFNGLEAGLGIVIFITLGLVALVQQQFWLVLMAAIIVVSLLAFLVFNKYPAKVFPGDSLTYSLGALLACFAILGNMERVALILFIPFIIEGILKARSKFKAECFGIPNKDNSLEKPYKKIYSLTHVAIAFLQKVKPSHKAYEKDVTWTLVIFEIIFAVIALAYVLSSIL